MSKAPMLLAIDQGTTSTRAIVFTANSEIVSMAQVELAQYYPEEGWVEYDPEAIWDATVQVCKQALEIAESRGGEVIGIGIANQRETTVVWEKETGKPVYNAIVWQDRRTMSFCSTLKRAGLEKDIRAKTGLLLDPYFSATKISWILDQIDQTREKSSTGSLLFGTIDTFLIWRLTLGKVHATDATNASRTSLFNIHNRQWDEDMLTLFNIPNACLPTVQDSSAYYGDTAPQFLGCSIPILGVAGDQQAAMVGQCCFSVGATKSTYGTGCFLLTNTGQNPSLSSHRLLTTIAYQIADQATYAIEGSIFAAGAAVQWLRDGLKIITRAEDTETLASLVDDTGGVYLVPAFTGLGAPYWDPSARGLLVGVTQSTGRAEIARAAIEASCYQTADLMDALAEDGIDAVTIRVDGGMAANKWFLQDLADILERPVERPYIMETTALGAAYLAGLQAGIFTSLDDITRAWRRHSLFTPNLPISKKEARLAGWQDAMRRALNTQDNAN